MGYTIAMDKAGRIVIPKDVRESIGADETTKFELEIIFDRIELTPKQPPRPAPQVLKEGGMWVVSTGGEPFDALESIKAVREERSATTTPDPPEVS